MNLGARGPRPQLASVPLADIALTLFAVVACAGMFSAVRGVGVRFEVADSAGSPSTTVWVRVLADGTARVDGERVAPTALAEAVRRRLDADPAARCVVHVAPDASYQTAMEALARLHGISRLSIPTQREVEAYAAAAGLDPFETGTP